MQNPEGKMDVHPVIIQEASDKDENATVSTDDHEAINRAIISVDSQSSSQTTTLSDPSQKLPEDSDDEMYVKTFKEKEIQTDETHVLISKAEYEELLQKASFCVDFQGDLNKISNYFTSVFNQSPEMNPNKFEQICKQVGAENLFHTLSAAMTSGRMSEERKYLAKLRSMVVIYIMMYSLSQRSNWFQVTLGRTLQQFGINERGLESLRNLGVAAHPRTVKAATKSSASFHLDNVASFFQEVVEKKHFLVVCIDDYHNIHTKRRPQTKTQSQAVHMSTLLVKTFPNVKAISEVAQTTPLLPTTPVQNDFLFNLVDANMAYLTQSYAATMPDWVVSKYFDQEAERHRLLLHDYQQTEIQEMKSMDNTKLIDSLHISLKSYEDLLTAFKHMLSNGLEIYLNHFLAPLMGDWPTQFFMRQLVYNLGSVSLPTTCKNIVPLIGPLHISLNSRECVLKNFHAIFAKLYSFLFGTKAKLAKTPKPWRVSLLLEVAYGGWTLIRETILSVFCHCKDIEFLTLVNLLDNYIPLVLSIYSIIFKSNNYTLYYKSLLCCWVMFMVFRRRHYDKALLVALSAFMYWKENDHPLYRTLLEALVAFDEYPVENFHSILRSSTNMTDTAEQISLKAKEIDACKHELHSFKTAFVPPKKFNFSRKRINKLKLKAAEFLTQTFGVLHSTPGMAKLLPRTKKQNKSITRWQLPNLFGNKVVTNKVLPLGFTSMKMPPNPEK